MLAARNVRLRGARTAYVRSRLLVCDKVGDLAHSPDDANVLFYVVDDRQRCRSSMVLTTNKPLDLWSHVLHDPGLAEAMPERILKHGYIVTLKGPSMRTRHLDPLPGSSD